MLNADAAFRERVLRSCVRWIHPVCPAFVDPERLLTEGWMKSYVIATGVLFGILTLVHAWRMAVEPHLASDPWFILVTVISAALCLLAWRLARRPQP